METDLMTAFNWFLFGLALTFLIGMYAYALYVIFWGKPQKKSERVEEWESEDGLLKPGKKSPPIATLF